MYEINNFVANVPMAKYVAEYRDSNRFIEFCKQCNKYQTCWACPPFQFDEDEYLSGYEMMYVIGTKIKPSPSLREMCRDAEKNRKVGAEIIEEVRLLVDEQLIGAEQKIIGSKAFFAGTCHLCKGEDCTRIIGEPCRHPNKIRPSLEALGFDIGKTTEELLDIQLKWSSDGTLPEYLTLVSGLLCKEQVVGVLDYFAIK